MTAKIIMNYNGKVVLKEFSNLKYFKIAVDKLKNRNITLKEFVKKYGI